MIKEEEIAWYRQNVINKYVDEVMKKIAMDENRGARLKRKIPLEYTPDYKRCKRCGNVKHISEFYKNPLKPKGVFDYCKECAKKRQRDLRNERQRSNRADTVHSRIERRK